MKNPKMSLAAESSAAVSVHSKADSPKQRLSCISCECHQTAGRRRCSASPEHEGQEGKENEQGLDSCRLNGSLDKQEAEDMECEETLFPDDDSNQILPVEQFFGNLDVVQVRCCVWATRLLISFRIEQMQKPFCVSCRTFLKGRQRLLVVFRGRAGDDTTTPEKTVMKRRWALGVYRVMTEGVLGEEQLT